MAVAKKSAKAPAVQSRNDRIDWRSLYLYAVCLITLLVVLFSTVSLINAIMNSVFPDPAYIDAYASPENAPSQELLDQQEKNNQIQAIKSAIADAFKSAQFAEPRFFTSLPSEGAKVIKRLDR
jgi:hypothetical protein